MNSDQKNSEVTDSSEGEIIPTEEKPIPNVFLEDPYAWAHVYFKHHFRRNSPGFHWDILNEAERCPNIAIAAPRGSAKSTIISFVRPIHKICFKQKRFIVILQNTFGKAAGSLETIKEEMKCNQALKKRYGIKLERDSVGDSIFVHPDGFKTRVLCKGHEQMGTIRGEKFGAYRPDLVIIDDLEDDEMVKNPERRRDLEEVFNDAVLPCGDEDTEFNFVCTILHDDCLAAKILIQGNYPQFRRKFYQIKFKDPKGNYVSIWDSKWSMEDIDAMEKENPESFAKERMNNPVSGARRKFKKDDFRYYKRVNNEFFLYGTDNHVIAKYGMEECVGAIACDLAWSSKRENDNSVILPAFLTPNSEILVGEFICKKGMRPNELEEALFEMKNKVQSMTNYPVSIGFEKATIEKIMKWFLKEAQKRRNDFLSFKELMWDADKITRIVTRLQPRYENHSIFHLKGMGDLEHEVLRVPDGAHDDIVDALQGVVQLLNTPKGKKAPKKKDDMFEWLVKQTDQHKNRSKFKYVLGKKKVSDPLKAKESWV